MKRLSMIAAGLLALGLTAARAETAGKSNTTVEVVPPSAPNTDTNGNPKAPSDVDVNPNPNPTPAPENKAVSPSPAGAWNHRGTPAVARAGERRGRRQSDAAGEAVAAAQRPGRQAAGAGHHANTAAITGARQAPVIPVGPAPFYTSAAEAGLSARAHLGLAAGRRHPGGRRLRGLHEQHDAEHDRRPRGMWTARVLAGTRRFFGVEAAYVGNARSIDALGLQSSAMLIVERRRGRRARERAGRHAARAAAGAVRLRRGRVVALSGDEHQHVHRPTWRATMTSWPCPSAAGSSTRSAASWRTRASPTARRTTTICCAAGGNLNYVGRRHADRRSVSRRAIAGGRLSDHRMTAWRCCSRCSVPSGACGWRSTSRRRWAARRTPICSWSTARSRACTAGSRCAAAGWRSRTSAATTAPTSTARS